MRSVLLQIRIALEEYEHVRGKIIYEPLELNTMGPGFS